MCHQHAQARREAGRLLRPVGEQRGRCDQQARGRAFGAFSYQQQSQHLDGLAQTHVVGQAGAQAQTRQQVQPAQADLLIRPQRGVQIGAGVDGRQTLWPAQSRQGLGQPWPGVHLRPLGRGRQLLAANGRTGPGQQAHGIKEAQALLACQALDLLELRQGLLKPLRVDLDPFAADEHQPTAVGQQALHLGGGQRLAIDGHRHSEVEQRILSDQRRLAPTDRGADRGARGPVGPPLGWHAHHHAGVLQLRHIVQEGQRLAGAPAQRLEDLATVDEALQPGAALAGSLQRRQKGEEALLVGSGSVFAQGLAQRPVLRLPLRRQPGGVGGEEGEGKLLVLAVLGQMDVNAADEIPGRVARLQEDAERLARGLQFGVQRGVELLPQPLQHPGRQVFRPVHRRRRPRQRLQLASIRRRHTPRQVLRYLGQRAQRGQVAHGQIPPPRDHRRQGRADVFSAKPQQDLA